MLSRRPGSTLTVSYGILMLLWLWRTTYFIECPTKKEPVCYKNFHRHFHCHKLNIHFKNRTSRKPEVGTSRDRVNYFTQHVPQPPTATSLTDTRRPMKTPSGPICRGCGANTPSWMNPVIFGVIPPPPLLPSRSLD